MSVQLKPGSSLEEMHAQIAEVVAAHKKLSADYVDPESALGEYVPVSGQIAGGFEIPASRDGIPIGYDSGAPVDVILRDQKGNVLAEYQHLPGGVKRAAPVELTDDALLIQAPKARTEEEILKDIEDQAYHGPVKEAEEIPMSETQRTSMLDVSDLPKVSRTSTPVVQSPAQSVHMASVPVTFLLTGMGEVTLQYKRVCQKKGVLALVRQRNGSDTFTPQADTEVHMRVGADPTELVCYLVATYDDGDEEHIVFLIAGVVE